VELSLVEKGWLRAHAYLPCGLWWDRNFVYSAIVSEKDLAIRKLSLRLENKRGKNTSIRKLSASTGKQKKEKKHRFFVFFLGERGTSIRKLSASTGKQKKEKKTPVLCFFFWEKGVDFP
jgi:hypothetical protein